MMMIEPSLAEELGLLAGTWIECGEEFSTKKQLGVDVPQPARDCVSAQ